MRITGIREQPIGISRYRDPRIPSGGLTTSLVAVLTDVVRAGQPVTGYGFASVGRYAQSGLIRDRFAPRLLQAAAPVTVYASGGYRTRTTTSPRCRRRYGTSPVSASPTRRSRSAAPPWTRICGASRRPPRRWPATGS